jgi:hypothetical protein
MSSIAKRLDAHFVACAAAAGAAVVGVAQKSEASVVYSGIVNIPVQTTTNGLYINIVNGQINEPGNTSGSTVPGWDLNIYGGGQYWWASQPGGNWGGVATAAGGGTLAQLPAGSTIDGTTINSTLTLTGTGFPTAAPGAYFGFRFTNEANGNQVEYAWGRYYEPAAGGPGVLVDFAYDNSGVGIQAGAVPAPGSVALLALGALGLAGRRRK